MTRDNDEHATAFTNPKRRYLKDRFENESDIFENSAAPWLAVRRRCRCVLGPRGATGYKLTIIGGN